MSVLSLLPFSDLSVNSWADQWFFPSSKSLPSAALSGLPAAFLHANTSPFSQGNFQVISPSFIKAQTSCMLLSSRFPLLMASETGSLNILQQFCPWPFYSKSKQSPTPAGGLRDAVWLGFFYLFVFTYRHILFSVYEKQDEKLHLLLLVQRGFWWIRQSMV